MTDNITETVKAIKQEFFAYRNGILADRIRSAGDSHKMIFGLNIPQIQEIASRYSQNSKLANQLWNNTDSRECRLIAPLLFPIPAFTEIEACSWISSIENTEIADNLCHKLLRNLNFAPSLINKYINSSSDIERYTALRLALNLICIGTTISTSSIKICAETENDKHLPLTQAISLRILEELSED
jgi:3-methyladenine DNA glycosylase AlkD